MHLLWTDGRVVRFGLRSWHGAVGGDSGRGLLLLLPPLLSLSSPSPLLVHFMKWAGEGLSLNQPDAGWVTSLVLESFSRLRKLSQLRYL